MRNPQVRWENTRSRHDGSPTDTQADTKNRSPSRRRQPLAQNKSLTNSLCNLPDVLAIAGINDTVLGGFNPLNTDKVRTSSGVNNLHPENMCYNLGDFFHFLIERFCILLIPTSYYFLDAAY